MDVNTPPPSDAAGRKAESSNKSAGATVKATKKPLTGRKSSLSRRRVPGICPDTGEVIKPKGKSAFSGAAAAVFIHRTRRVISNKTKKKVLIKKLRLKKLKKRPSQVNNRERTNATRGKSMVIMKTLGRLRSWPLQKLTPRQEQLRKCGNEDGTDTQVIYDTTTPTRRLPGFAYER